LPKIKVQPGSVTLCGKCENALIFERRGGGVVAYCNVTTQPISVPLDIVKCSDFRDKNTISQYEMEKIAWTVTTDKSGKKIGFKPPTEKE
jgi:hypothetical protein